MEPSPLDLVSRYAECWPGARIPVRFVDVRALSLRPSILAYGSSCLLTWSPRGCVHAPTLRGTLSRCRRCRLAFRRRPCHRLPLLVSSLSCHGRSRTRGSSVQPLGRQTSVARALRCGASLSSSAAPAVVRDSPASPRPSGSGPSGPVPACLARHVARRLGDVGLRIELRRNVLLGGWAQLPARVGPARHRAPAGAG